MFIWENFDILLDLLLSSILIMNNIGIIIGGVYKLLIDLNIFKVIGLDLMFIRVFKEVLSEIVLVFVFIFN